MNFGEDPNPDLDVDTRIFQSFFTVERFGQKRYSTVQHDISKMYWARYVLVDQALRVGGMRSTECPSCYYYVQTDIRLRRVWGTGRITILGYGSLFGCFVPHSSAQFILVACLGAHGSV